MRMRVSFTLLCCSALLACSTTGQEPEIPERGVTPGFACNSDGLSKFVGQKADSATGASALAQSGAKSLRWIPPNSAVTMDFRQDRLNIEYDEKMVISRVNCG